jgi:hypothetical protein
MGCGFAAKYINILAGAAEAAPGGLTATYFSRINIELCFTIKNK